MMIIPEKTDLEIPAFWLHFAIPREKQGIKEFDDKEFLTRKTYKKNKELTTLRLRILGIYEAKVNKGLVFGLNFCSEHR